MPANHMIPVSTEATTMTGNATTACAMSSHSPGSDAAASSFVLDRCPPAPLRTLPTRHHSTSPDQRAIAQDLAAIRDPPGTTELIVPTHTPHTVNSAPPTAVTGAVRRYSDSTNVRRANPATHLAPGRRRA